MHIRNSKSSGTPYQLGPYNSALALNTEVSTFQGPYKSQGVIIYLLGKLLPVNLRKECLVTMEIKLVTLC